MKYKEPKAKDLKSSIATSLKTKEKISHKIYFLIIGPVPLIPWATGLNSSKRNALITKMYWKRTIE